MKHRLAWSGLGCVSLGLLYLAAIAALGLSSRPAGADLAIVLGNEVLANGEPSPRLRARLDAALGVYRAGYCPHFFVSGGTGLSGYNEALVMRDYLVAAGVPADAVTADPDGVDTRATVRHAAALAQSRGWGTVLVVSQFFHLPRIGLACRQAGLEVAGGASPAYYEWRDLYSLLREGVALPFYALRGV
jgi:vancomycin permeability regulator SanA